MLFQHLAEVNEDLYDYYVNRLYTVDGDFVKEEWNEKTSLRWRMM
jgi:hypothetical protein